MRTAGGFSLLGTAITVGSLYLTYRVGSAQVPIEYIDGQTFTVIVLPIFGSAVGIATAIEGFMPHHSKSRLDELNQRVAKVSLISSLIDNNRVKTL